MFRSRAIRTSLFILGSDYYPIDAERVNHLNFHSNFSTYCCKHHIVQFFAYIAPLVYVFFGTSPNPTPHPSPRLQVISVFCIPTHIHTHRTQIRSGWRRQVSLPLRCASCKRFSKLWLTTTSRELQIVSGPDLSLLERMKSISGSGYASLRTSLESNAGMPEDEGFQREREPVRSPPSPDYGMKISFVEVSSD